MLMENLNKTLSENLIRYRVQAGYTQLELGEMIGYSDKSVSKWERGEGIPDVSVLCKLAEIYGVTVNDFVYSTDAQVIKKKKDKISHHLIVMLSTGLVWLVASLFFVLFFIIDATSSHAWLSFIYAIFVSGIVLTVFSVKWGNSYTTAATTSVILWGAVLSLCLSIPFSIVWIICLCAGIFQLLIVFFFILRRHIHINKNKK